MKTSDAGSHVGRLRGGLNRFAVIYPATALSDTAYPMATLGMVFFLRDYFEATPAEVGILSALPWISYIVGCYAFRPISHRVLPRRLLLFAEIMNALCVVAILQATTLLSVGIFSALYGVAMSLFWPPLMGWLSAGIEGPRLSKAIGTFSFCWSAGNILGPFLAGALAVSDSRLALRVVVSLHLLVAAVILSGSVFIARVRADRHREPRGETSPRVRDDGSPLRFASRIGVAASYLLIGAFLVVFPIYARSHLGLSELTIGSVLLIRAAMTTVAFVLIGRLSFWHHRPGPIVINLSLLALMSFGIALSGGIEVFVWLSAPIGVLIALAYYQSAFHGVSGSKRRAQRMSTHEVVLTSGKASGAIGGAFAFQVTSLQSTFLIIGVALVAATLVQIVLIWRPGRETRRTERGRRRIEPDRRFRGDT